MTLPATGLLAGETVFITGAAQGNGRAIALGLARQGARVAVADVQADGAESTATAIRAAGGESLSVTLDVTDADACQTVADRVELVLGPVSVLINNAGIIRRLPLDEPSYPDAWRSLFAVNVDGACHVTRAFLPQLRRTRGRVVNVGSIMSFLGGPGLSAYAASKGAVLQFTRALAHELAADGIRVNGIAPGVIATPMTEITRQNPQAIGRFMAHTPLGRVGEPEELIGPVLFLASALSSYVTGVMLPVDGGYLTA